MWLCNSGEFYSIVFCSFITMMDHDDDDGIGYIADTHLLRPSGASQTEMTLLHVPGKDVRRQGSFSSNISDLEEPIYDRTTRQVQHVSE